MIILFFDGRWRAAASPFAVIDTFEEAIVVEAASDLSYNTVEPHWAVNVVMIFVETELRL